MKVQIVGYGLVLLTAITVLLALPQTQVETGQKSQLEQRVERLEKQVNGICIGVWGKTSAEMQPETWHVRKPESFSPLKFSQSEFLNRYRQAMGTEFGHSPAFAKFASKFNPGTVTNWVGRFDTISPSKLSDGQHIIYLRMGPENDLATSLGSCSFKGDVERFYSMKQGTPITIKSAILKRVDGMCLSFDECVFDK